jgi:23S rRNA (uracil1939-C5)-methyltransferase
MVNFYKPPKHKKKPTAQNIEVEIDGITTHGEGVCRAHNPTVFVNGALPGETVKVKVTKQQKNNWHGQVNGSVEGIQNMHPQRVKPFCKFYEQCGGCSTQHCAPDAMLSFKQDALDHQFKRTLSMETLPWTAPLTSPVPEYRRKARLAIDARNPKKVKLGFKAANSSNVVSIDQCPVLLPELQSIMLRLHLAITNGQLSHEGIRFVGHITLMKVDDVCSVTVNCVRDLSNQAINAWASVADELQSQIESSLILYIEKNKQFVTQFGATKPNDYVISADDFIQVNDVVNTGMLNLAIQHLSPENSDRVLDLFAGLGNFTFPIANSAAQVIGVEGGEAMVQKASQLALEKGIANAKFVCRDLSSPSSLDDLLVEKPNKVLLDPSRDGADAVCTQLASSDLECIVYISCNPQTWLRDAQTLLTGQYRLSSLTLMDMFPYTPHSELLSVFTPK